MPLLKTMKEIYDNVKDVIDFIYSIDGFSHKHKDGSRSPNKLGVLMVIVTIYLLALFFYSIVVTVGYNKYRTMAEIIRPGITVEIREMKEKDILFDMGTEEE